MLVLQRTATGRPQDDETVIFCPDGTQIRIAVMSCSNRKVKLGFDAPPGYRILRRDAIEKGTPDAKSPVR